VVANDHHHHHNNNREEKKERLFKEEETMDLAMLFDRDDGTSSSNGGEGEGVLLPQQHGALMAPAAAAMTPLLPLFIHGSSGSVGPNVHKTELEEVDKVLLPADGSNNSSKGKCGGTNGIRGAPKRSKKGTNDTVYYRTKRPPKVGIPYHAFLWS